MFFMSRQTLSSTNSTHLAGITVADGEVVEHRLAVRREQTERQLGSDVVASFDDVDHPRENLQKKGAGTIKFPSKR